MNCRFFFDDISLRGELFHCVVPLSLQVLLMGHFLLELSEMHPHVMQLLIPAGYLLLQIQISLFEFGILQTEMAILRG